MSKRVTLSDREVWHIVEAIKSVQSETTLTYQSVKAGRQALQDIIDKLTDGNDLLEKRPKATDE